VTVARTNGIPINALRFDLGATAPLNGVVQTTDDRPRRHKRFDQQHQQRVAQCPTRPRRPTEHTVIGLKLSLVTQPHDPQHGRDRAIPWHQNRADQQDLCMLPNQVGKVRRKDLNQAKIVIGQGRPRILVMEKAAYPTLSISATG
jgi:hypothetical protein